MPIADTKGNTDEPLLGMDYGVPPRYMLMANPALMELWNQAKCIGLGYLKLPKHGSFTDVPCVGVMFEDLGKGIRVFKLLQSWDCQPGSGAGTDISFIEDKAANSYTMTLSPNIPEMIRRLLDPSMLVDYSLMTMGLSVGKTITLSANFDWLRNQPRSKPIIFVPGYNQSIAPIEHALSKADVQFFDKSNVPKDSLEYAMSADESGSGHPREPKPLPIDPIEISAKRGRQLKKFFPIALARLEHNSTFVRMAEELDGKRERWQVVQAACNVLCIERFAAFRTAGGKVDFHKAYDALRHKPEKVGDDLPLRKQFNAEELEAQIAEDVRYLFEQVRASAVSDDPTAALRALGLLR